MKPIKAAVVGCGALANGTHLPTLSTSDMFELVATCDSRISAADAAKEKWGAQRSSDDWHEIVNADDIELIVLCTHTNLRGELICAAAEKGIPVYTEKPLANSREEMHEIFRSTQEHNVSVCVGHNRRSSPAMLEFKRLAELASEKGADRGAIIDRNSGKKNKLHEEEQTQLLIRVNDDIRTWKLWIFEDQEGIILAEMVHFIDIALWLTPSDPIEVYACGSPRGNFTEIIRFRDGSIATLQHTMVGNFDYPKELFELSRNNVSIGMNHHLEVVQRGMDSEELIKYFPMSSGHKASDKEGLMAFHEQCDFLQNCRKEGKELPFTIAGVNKGHRDQLERFGRHIRGEGENPCPVDSAIVVTNVALKLLESARLGMPVKVGPEDINLVFAEREY